MFNDLPNIPTNDASYEPPTTNQTVINDILQHYEINPFEADSSVRQTLIQQSIVDVKNWGSDPFSSSFAANKIIDPKMLQFA